jgi:hypothetical protein
MSPLRVDRPASPDSLSAELIAPCGMDCGLCYTHLREKNRCPGCSADDAGKPRYCAVCKIKTCQERADGAFSFCFECASFPCPRLRQLDRRYRTKYGMSMLENQARIRDGGVDAFVEGERARWTCPGCGSLLCVHRPDCVECGRVWNTPDAPPK